MFQTVPQATHTRFLSIHSFSLLAERTRCRVNYLLRELDLDYKQELTQ